jgi:sialic acid synthase SpsE
MRSMRIGRRIIDEQNPYIIAEIGVNHENSMPLARRLIELAKEGGAHAAKFQTYKASLLASSESPAYWDTSKEPCLSQIELFRRYDSFGPSEYQALAQHCTQVGIDFLSTPFDLEAVDSLAPLVPCFKVASADITNLPLLRRVGQQGKPVLLSTGAANASEIDWALRALVESGASSVALLHCVLNYPTRSEDARLAGITGLMNRYDRFVIGYSDHTVPDQSMSSLTTAFLLGARIIEKHFTHDRSLKGNDHYHAMDVTDLRRFVDQLASLKVLLGSSTDIGWAPAEDTARRNARRSLVLASSVKAGSRLTDADVLCKRPAFGISPIYFDQVVGRRTLRDLSEDHVLQWNDLEGSIPDDDCLWQNESDKRQTVTTDE